MSTATEAALARATLSLLSTLGGAISTYRGTAGDVPATGYIERADEFFGGDVGVSDARWVAVLLVADVGDPQRGDEVTDEDGQRWILLDKQPSLDEHVTDWTIRKK